ncbi:hypothetical protein ABN028_10550 [Actinopolymorpha sp. B17G11]|uniref:hypothetical protein n=1 Tax=unclassified Actinopolymorpha TaxID=2627063 RepID=UPI0032D8FE4B
MFEHTERIDDDGDDKFNVKVTLGITGDWRAQPLKVISGITEGIKSLDGTLREAVHLARKDGSSWEEIGKALGVSRQSAWERFSVD